MMDAITFLGMAGGSFLLIAAVLLLLDFYFLFRIMKFGSRNSTIAFVASLTACLFIVASYLMLTALFLGDAFSYREVYTYSSSGLSVLYKLGGPWIGSSGSLLFITFILALGYGIYRARSFGKESLDRVITCQVMNVLIIFLILVTLIQSPFRHLQVTPPEGMGLNPLLQTPWVLLHPPIIFLGYAAIFFAFVFLLAGLVTGNKRAPGRGQSMRLLLLGAWLLLTAGIALGALWSYRVLGWGGYWAWDPVETASLLPWLALTAYFHLPPSEGEGSADFMLGVTFFMVIFATAMTRGGFSQSVHAFGESPAGYLFLGFALAGLLACLLVLRRKGGFHLSFPVDTSSLSSISRIVAFLSLVALLAVCFLGSAAPVTGSVLTKGPFTLEPDFFTLVTYPFTLAFVAALVGCNVPLRPRSYAILMAVVSGIGIAMAFMGVPTPFALANFGLPILVTAGIAVTCHGIRVFRLGTGSLRLWGRTLVHLAVVILLLGVFVSSAAQSESAPVLATEYSLVDALGSTVAVHGFTVSEGKGRVYLPSHSLVGPEYSSLKTEVGVLEAGRVRGGSLWMYEYLNYGVVSEPLILSTPSKDLYLSMHQTNSSYSSLLHALAGETIPPKDVTIVVKYVPLVWFVWLGILLMGFGVGALFLEGMLGGRRVRKEPGG